MWVEESLAQARYDICKSCDRFISLTRQCKECGCLMPLKVKFDYTVCPLKKWESLTVVETTDSKN